MIQSGPFPLVLRPLQGLASSPRHLLDGIFANLSDHLLDELSGTADRGGHSHGTDGLDHVGIEPGHTGGQAEPELLPLPGLPLSLRDKSVLGGLEGVPLGGAGGGEEAGVELE